MAQVSRARRRQPAAARQGAKTTFIPLERPARGRGAQERVGEWIGETQTRDALGGAGSGAKECQSLVHQIHVEYAIVFRRIGGRIVVIVECQRREMRGGNARRRVRGLFGQAGSQHASPSVYYV